ncbi:hypothetical protein Lal_00046082 [Lupinus albus]|nr:hypothetical protein Lal_00046082 [Lupinus albus]
MARSMMHMTRPETTHQATHQTHRPRSENASVSQVRLPWSEANLGTIDNSVMQARLAQSETNLGTIT